MMLQVELLRRQIVKLLNRNDTKYKSYEKEYKDYGLWAMGYGSAPCERANHGAELRGTATHGYFPVDQHIYRLWKYLLF